MEVRPFDTADHEWAAEASRRAWGSIHVARLGEVIDASAREFYERWGMTAALVHPDGVRASRAVKPSIPEVDAVGVPITDEIEYELLLTR
jgi:hypothetical protein